MTVTVKNLVPSKDVADTQTTQYTATGVTTIIDKFTATNYSASAATISVNLVTLAGSAGKVQVAGDEYVAGADRAALYAIIKQKPEFEGAEDA